jgi:hypothetical protein
MGSTQHDHEIRIRALEQRCRRLSLACVTAASALVVGIGCAALAPRGTPEVVRAQGFEVVDAKGRVRATLGQFAPGSVGLALRELDGSPSVTLLLLEREDGSDDPRSASMLHLESQSPSDDADQDSIVQLYAGPDGAVLGLTRAEHRQVKLAADSDRTALEFATLGETDEDPRHTSVSIETKAGAPSITLQNESGAKMRQAP